MKRGLSTEVGREGSEAGREGCEVGREGSESGRERSEGVCLVVWTERCD